MYKLRATQKFKMLLSCVKPQTYKTKLKGLLELQEVFLSPNSIIYTCDIYCKYIVNILRAKYIVKVKKKVQILFYNYKLFYTTK